MTIQPVILSGGTGSRLWPLSREKYPKQLLPLVDQQTLLQATVLRTGPLPGVQVLAPQVVSNEEYRFVIAEQLRLIGHPGQIILEPAGRNTAPALTLAALAAPADAILLVMPADHVILDNAAFHATILQGLPLATDGQIVTFGITPDHAETGYGYIQTGRHIEGNKAHQIARFVEKPDLTTAQTYLASGDYLWNSGLFMMRAQVWLDALQICRPDILQACREAMTDASTDGDFLRVNKAAFVRCPSDSIDYAVMEKLTTQTPGLPTGVVLPMQAGWSDIGAWDALWNILPKDENGNVQRGDVLMHGSRNTYAHSSGRLIACLGTSDLIVVETDDAVLVANRHEAQSIKGIVDQLKKKQRPEAQWHRKVHRPWGWYDSIDAGHRFQVKRIVVKPGGTLSLQMHHHRAEHWIVVSGTARVTRGEEQFLVSENQSTYIPLGTKHRLENPGAIPLEMIEVQSGAYLGEDDIVRFEDVYGR